MPNTYRKGKRVQRKCRDKLQERGWQVEVQRGSRFGSTDFFNQFDIIAIKKDEKPRFIQVKTNQISQKKEILTFAKENINYEHLSAEIWLYKDYFGFKAYKIVDDQWEVIFDETV